MIKDIKKQARITQEHENKLSKILKKQKINFSEWVRKRIESARIR